MNLNQLLQIPVHDVILGRFVHIYPMQKACSLKCSLPPVYHDDDDKHLVSRIHSNSEQLLLTYIPFPSRSTIFERNIQI